MASGELTLPVGQRITLAGHFEGLVTLEAVRVLSPDVRDGFECRVRLADGRLEETILSYDEARAIAGAAPSAAPSAAPVDAERLRLLIESARIRLAYMHDRQFAVSLSGIRTLPHQIEAVYQRMLPQPRLRFLLADDPGAGKTIMAGLLIKEMKLREAIDRILILCPAPLTIQWQDELLRWFGEPFDIIFSAVDQQQLINPWQRTHPGHRVDRLRQAGRRPRAGLAAALGPRHHRRGPQVLGLHDLGRRRPRGQGRHDQALRTRVAARRRTPTICSC